MCFCWKYYLNWPESNRPLIVHQGLLDSQPQWAFRHFVILLYLRILLQYGPIHSTFGREGSQSKVEHGMVHHDHLRKDEMQIHLNQIRNRKSANPQNWKVGRSTSSGNPGKNGQLDPVIWWLPSVWLHKMAQICIYKMWVVSTLLIKVLLTAGWLFQIDCRACQLQWRGNTAFRKDGNDFQCDEKRSEMFQWKEGDTVSWMIQRACCKLYFLQCVCGCFRKWWYPQNTPKWSFLVGKPMVVGYHHFRKPPCIKRGHETSVESTMKSYSYTAVLLLTPPNYCITFLFRCRKCHTTNDLYSALWL